jgi:tRNA nucleotidyltransferase (CCA-adding enzyme)
MTIIVPLFELEKQIDFEKFSQIFSSDIKKVITTVRKYGFDIRVVGGAVRDFLLGRSPRDIDFATDAEPAELIFIFDLEGIDYDVEGIQHGTVKAVFGNSKIDVTSIKYKLKLTGTQIAIDRPTGWKEDSYNRDITINSMSIDLDGKLYDYQNAIKDLHEQRVRYCPGAIEKIQQDPLIIMRWFKALAFFPKPKYLAKDVKVIQSTKHLLPSLKDDKRLKFLLAGLLSTPNSKKIFALMCELGVAQEIALTCSN